MWEKKRKLWWHISTTRYEIAIMIILENYRDKKKKKKKLSRKYYLDKKFHDKNISIFLNVRTDIHGID